MRVADRRGVDNHLLGWFVLPGGGVDDSRILVIRGGFYFG
jgi:hypothetical protein